MFQSQALAHPFEVPNAPQKSLKQYFFSQDLHHFVQELFMKDKIK